MARVVALVLFARAVSASGACVGGACRTGRVGGEEQDVPSLLQIQHSGGEDHHPYSIVGPPILGSESTAVGAMRSRRSRERPQASRRSQSRRERTQVSCDLPMEECHMEAGEACELAHMKLKAVHHVFPGGLKCGNGDPFWFAVKKGQKGKLLFVLDGSDELDAVILDARLGPWSGIMNYSDLRNPYADYTIIRVPTCYADVHIGNNADNTAYSPHGILGYGNANAALQWALSQFPHLSKLAILGMSEGAMGLQLWAGRIIEEFADRDASVVVYSDSFAGFFYPVSPWLTRWQAAYFRDTWWNACGTPLVPSEEEDECNNRVINFDPLTWAYDSWTLQGHFAKTMRAHPEVLFLGLTTKADSELYDWSVIQNDILRSVLPEPPAPLPRGEVYRETTLSWQAYAQNHNFRAYLIDGDGQKLLGNHHFFSATPLGTEAEDGLPTLLKWTHGAENYCKKKGLDHAPGHVCVGEKVSITSREQELPDGLTWCDATFR